HLPRVRHRLGLSDKSLRYTLSILLQFGNAGSQQLNLIFGIGIFPTLRPRHQHPANPVSINVATPDAGGYLCPRHFFWQGVGIPSKSAQIADNWLLVLCL
ncbi:MAG: hypothetical protein R6V19_04020, partial [Armatimonadota bacterium]